MTEEQQSAENDVPCSRNPNKDCWSPTLKRACLTHWCWRCNKTHCPDEAPEMKDDKP